ncbi:hypothetical protein [Pseudomonas eucalypticola]|uniref:Uncharacterized protein n=2 Tax=Pseudomonas TaxID=286 RepID=A0A7D5D4Q1_9PSED|nr:hypothetical protein [Pseudomonas eucalypticola]QKZ02758.1 hypothetical protein HWQ56_02645 [Pseudomonas eucalypticola]
MWLKRLLDKIDERLPSRRQAASFQVEQNELVVLRNGCEPQRYSATEITDVYALRRELYVEDCLSLVIEFTGGAQLEVDEGSPGWVELGIGLARLKGCQVNELWFLEVLQAEPGKRVPVVL